MTTTLTILDFTLIGMISGFTTFLSMALTMRYMRYFEKKRKMIVMGEMLSQMHDQAETQQQFEEIVERFRNSQGEERQ